jgi:hypothetical protein
MIKKDERGVKLRTGDWVRYHTFGETRIGRITNLSVTVGYFDGMPPRQITDDVEVTQPNGDRVIRSGFYMRKITEDEAMLHMLES